MTRSFSLQHHGVSPYCVFTGQLRRLEQEMWASLEGAWAPGTKTNMRVQQKLFLDFCAYFSLEPCSASLQTLCLFAQFVARGSDSSSSVSSYLTTVKWLHVINGQCTDIFSSEMIKLVKKGIVRAKQHRPQQALPITPDMLKEFRDLLDLGQARDATLWALMVLSFFLMTRKSNMVSDSVPKFDSSKQLLRGDVKLRHDALLVSLKWSKTNQFGDREHIVPLFRLPGSPLCPWEAYTNMIRKVPGQDGDPAFMVKRGKHWVPLTYSQFSKSLKMLVEATGRNSRAYSTHSLRRGGATFLASLGVDKDKIKLIGDWRSDAVNEYLFCHMQAKIQVAQAVKKSLSS